MENSKRDAFVVVNDLFSDGLIRLPNTMINRSSVIPQKSKLSLTIRKTLGYVIKQNINPQRPTLGKKFWGGVLHWQGELFLLLYLLCLIVTSLYALLLVIEKLGNSHQ